MNTTHRTGNEWIAGLDRKPGFGADFAAEDIIDAPCWIPTGSIKACESYAFSHDFRPGTWGGDKYD
jgi:hypothetical protein